MNAAKRKGVFTKLGRRLSGRDRKASLAVARTDSLVSPNRDRFFLREPSAATIIENTVDLKRIITTFTYRIEAKPQGGFIAYASDPSLPPLEAATRPELQQKIQDNIGAALAAEFPGLNLPSGNQPVKFDFHIESKPGGGFLIHSHDPARATIEGATHEEIEHPFLEKLAGVVGQYFLPELSQALAKQGGSGDVKVIVDRNVRFGVKTGSPIPGRDGANHLMATDSSPARATNSGGAVDASDGSPITFEASKSWPILRFFLLLIVIAALIYFLGHR